METVSMDMPALANVTNAMVALVNENSQLKQLNQLLAERLKEYESEQISEGERLQEAAPDAEGHER